MPGPTFCLRKHNSNIMCVKFMCLKNQSGENTLASGDVNGNIKLWDLETRRPFIEFRAISQKCSIPALEYISDKHMLLLQTRSPSNGYIQGYDMQQFKNGSINNSKLFQFDTHCSSFCKFCVVQSGIDLPQNSIKNEHQMNANEMKESSEEKENNENMNEEKNESLLSKMLNKSRMKNKLKSNERSLSNSISLNDPFSNLLIAGIGSKRSLLQIWSVNSNMSHQCVHTCDFDDKMLFSYGRGMIIGVNAFHTNVRNEIRVLMVSDAGIIDCYDVRAGKLFMSANIHSTSFISNSIETQLTCFAVNERKTRAIVGSSNNLYQIQFKYSTAQIQIKREIEINNQYGKVGVNVVKLCEKQCMFGSGGWDHRIRIFDWKTLKPLTVLKGNQSSITDIDFDHNRRLIAASSKNQNIALYQL